MTCEKWIPRSLHCVSSLPPGHYFVRSAVVVVCLFVFVVVVFCLFVFTFVDVVSKRLN